VSVSKGNGVGGEGRKVSEIEQRERESEKKGFFGKSGGKGVVVKGEEFLFSDSPWSGIFSHLTTECGGNVHEKGVVNITTSGNGKLLGDGRSNPLKVVDHGSGGAWFSENAPNSWICFEFKRHSISLKNYTLKSSPFDPGHWHPREWVIEGSNDGSIWEVVDRRNTQELNGKSIVKTFGCSGAESSTFFRFIRLRQTGKSCHSGIARDILSFANIEFFGTLQDNAA
jgi:hypothetical protein